METAELKRSLKRSSLSITKIKETAQWLLRPKAAGPKQQIKPNSNSKTSLKQRQTGTEREYKRKTQNARDRKRQTENTRDKETERKREDAIIETTKRANTPQGYLPHGNEVRTRREMTERDKKTTNHKDNNTGEIRDK